MKAIRLFDCRFWWGLTMWPIHHEKKNQAKQRGSTQEKTINLRTLSLFVWEKKKGLPEAWKVFFSGRASIRLSGEDLTQTRASHTHPAAGNRIHFAIFFL